MWSFQMKKGSPFNVFIKSYKYISFHTNLHLAKRISIGIVCLMATAKLTVYEIMLATKVAKVAKKIENNITSLYKYNIKHLQINKWTIFARI